MRFGGRKGNRDNVMNGGKYVGFQAEKRVRREVERKKKRSGEGRKDEHLRN